MLMVIFVAIEKLSPIEQICVLGDGHYSPTAASENPVLVSNLYN